MRQHRLRAAHILRPVRRGDIDLAEWNPVSGQAIDRQTSFRASLRDVADMLAGRGHIGSYETVRCWANKFGPAFAASTCIDPADYETITGSKIRISLSDDWMN